MFRLPLAAAALAVGALPAVSETVTVEVWADNWFELHVNGTKVLEDSVSITTERSFNSETGRFQVDLPAQVAFIVKDFKENDTGLEYIGSNRQQMGDGGFIAQFRDSSGQIVGVTDDSARCLVIHHAPVETSCAAQARPVVGQGACAARILSEPSGWDRPGFDDSGWPRAVEHSESAVRPKDGYDQIRWDRSASLIWSADLERDNTLLCRMVIGG